MAKRELSQYIMRQITSQGLVESTDNLLSTAKMLGGISRMILDEEVTTINPSQILEAGLRCIDTIELIVLACVPDDEDETDYKQQWEESETYEELAQVRERLNRLRGKLLGISEEE